MLTRKATAILCVVLHRPRDTAAIITAVLISMRSSSRLSAPLRAFTSTANLFHSNPLNLGGVQTRIKSAPTDAQSLNPQIRRGVPIPKKIPNVKKVIAVYSAKGGVGKSTTSVNLATTLAYHNGLRVAILDADLFGPSIPRMMNLSGKEAVLTPDSNFLVPLTNHGVQCMSMGFLINEGQVVAWRGMMVMKAIEQLLWQVQWADVDVLVIDMPPGTGDTQISILQQVELDGVVIVSTPQDVALSDAKKGIALFNTRKVPILGLVENMSFFTCPNCSHESHIFNPPSKTGVSSRLDILAQSLGAEVIARVPLDPLVCEAADSGKLVASVDSKTKQVYVDLAQKVKALLFN